MPPFKGLHTLEPDEGQDERRVEEEHDEEDQGLVKVVHLDEGRQGDDAQDPDVHQELDGALSVGGQPRLCLRHVDDGGVRGEGGGDPHNVQRGDNTGEHHHKHSYGYHKFWHCLTI